jgi:uncharacterized protein (DUF1330 family)
MPHLVIVETDAGASDAAMAYAVDAGQALAAHSGRLVLAAPAASAEVLERGSEQRAVIVFKFPSEADTNAFWSDASHQSAFAALSLAPGFLHAIALEGIPDEGLPGEPLPTAANVSIPDLAGPRAYMLVQGTVSDPGPIGKYMETIVPMIIERGGVYRVWTDPDGPSLLAGAWSPQYLVFSEWPSVEVARDFWFSDTYQNVAIPTRRPASDFTVLLFEASA